MIRLRVEFDRMNQLIAHITPEEQVQLINLLTRLYHSINEPSQSTEDA